MSSNAIVGGVVVAYLVLMLAIGVWYTKKSRTISGFLTGGRGAGAVVGGFALAVTYMSTASLLGLVSAASQIGVSWALFGGIGMVLGFIVCMAGLGPRLRASGAMTMGEFFGTRYGPRTRTVSSAIIAIILFLYVVAQIQGGALVMQAILGTSYAVGVLVMGGIFVGYSVLGGMRAITLTSFLQCILLLFGVIAVTVGLFGRFSWPEMTGRLSEVRPEYFTSAGSGGLGFGITFGILCFLTCLSGPHVLSRFFASTSGEVAKRTSAIAALMGGLFYLIVIFPPIAVILLVDSPENRDMSFLLAAEAVVGNPWILGIILAGILAAAMSTADAMLLNASSAIVHDLGSRWISAERAPMALRLVTLALGLGVIVITISPPAAILQVVILALSMLAGAFFIPVVLGLTMTKGPSSDTAGYSSMIVGLVTTAITHPATPIIRMPEQAYAGLLGVAAALVVYLGIRSRAGTRPRSWSDRPPAHQRSSHDIGRK